VTGIRVETQASPRRVTRTRALFVLFLVAFQIFFATASAIAFRTRPQGLIASDGKGYYAWLRSLALDRDLDFRNDFQLIFPPDPVPDLQRVTPRGLVINKYPVGVAVSEVPGFLAGHAIAFALGMPRNGVSAPYQFAVTLWLQALFLVALAVLWVTLVRLGAEPVIAALGVASALTATNLIQYATRPTMAHAPGLSMMCFALYFAVAAREPARQLWKLGAVGALLGLAVIIRPSNAALASFFVPFLLKPLGRSVANWVVFIGSFACVVALQVLLASLLWGHLAFSGYVGEGFTSGVRGIVGSLFSSRHGLFIYHPWYLVVLLLSILATRSRETRSIAVGTLLSFAAFVVINGTWWSWWFGDSFGNRSFIELIPPLVVTGVLWLSALAPAQRSRARIGVAAAVFVLSLSNAWLWGGYILRRYPPNGEHTVAQAYLWPWR
jgi:hypothetical protein